MRRGGEAGQEEEGPRRSEALSRIPSWTLLRPRRFCWAQHQHCAPDRLLQAHHVPAVPSCGHHHRGCNRAEARAATSCRCAGSQNYRQVSGTAPTASHCPRRATVCTLQTATLRHVQHGDVTLAAPASAAQVVGPLGTTGLRVSSRQRPSAPRHDKRLLWLATSCWRRGCNHASRSG